MEKDTVVGTVKEIKGKVRSAVGHVTGSKKEEICGIMEEAEGKLQKNYGKIKEVIKDTVNS